MPSYAKPLSPNRKNAHENVSRLRQCAHNWQNSSLTSKPRRLLICRKTSGPTVVVATASTFANKSKNNLEQLNAVPFPGMVRIERCVLHPNPVTGGRPGIEHLKRVATRPKGFWKCALNLCPFDRHGFFNRPHWFLPTERSSEFLGGSSRRQRSHDCDHQCLHVSLSFEPYEMLPITTPAHNIFFDGFY